MSTLARGLAFLVTLMCILGAPSRAAAQMTPAELEQALSQATTKFDEAAAMLKTDTAGAHALLDESIAGYQRIVREGRIRNSAIYYNLANAHMLKGDLGRAILNYRRAQALNPGDVNLAANLASARQRVTPRIAPATEGRVLRTLLFWHYDLSAQARFLIFAISFGALWIVALLRIALLAPNWAWWGIAALAIASGASLSSLLVDRAEQLEPREAVITASNLVGRKGPDAAAYEPSFTEPLGAGVEVRINTTPPPAH